MYTISNLEVLTVVEAIPRQDVGAPLPMVLATDNSLVLAYHCSETPANWDGRTVRVVDCDSPDELIACVRFEGPYTHRLGPPNDEALSGHPLYARGLTPIAV
jgi:hypothetical protein